MCFRFLFKQARSLQSAEEMYTIEAHHFHKMLLKYHNRHPHFRVNLVMIKMYSKAYFVHKRPSNN